MQACLVVVCHIMRVRMQLSWRCIILESFGAIRKLVCRDHMVIGGAGPWVPIASINVR